MGCTLIKKERSGVNVIKSFIYSLLNNLSGLLFAVTPVKVDEYAVFNTKTDATISFDGCAGKIHLYSADEAMRVEFNEATNNDSMLIPSGQVVELSGAIKSIQVKGTSKGGTVYVSADMLSSGKGDFELQDDVNVRKQ
jgi:hypothetical protein